MPNGQEQQFDGQNAVPGYTLFQGKDGKSFYLKGENLSDSEISSRVAMLRGQSQPSIPLVKTGEQQPITGPFAMRPGENSFGDVLLRIAQEANNAAAKKTLQNIPQREASPMEQVFQPQAGPSPAARGGYFLPRYDSPEEAKGGAKQAISGVATGLVGGAGGSLLTRMAAGGAAAAGGNVAGSLAVGEKPDLGEAATSGALGAGAVGLIGGAAKAVPAISRLIGGTEKASRLFNEVAIAAKDEPIQISDEVYDALKDIKQLKDTGARVPMAASKLANRLNNVDEELHWDEAKRFYSNISRLSANEYQSMAPQANAAVAKLARALGSDLNDAAASVDKGDEYRQAMQIWGTTRAWQKFSSNAWNFATDKAGAALAGAAGGGGMYYGVKKLLEK
jgi:hypothetical protein